MPTSAAHPWAGTRREKLDELTRLSEQLPGGYRQPAPAMAARLHTRGRSGADRTVIQVLVSLAVRDRMRLFGIEDECPCPLERQPGSHILSHLIVDRKQCIKYVVSVPEHHREVLDLRLSPDVAFESSPGDQQPLVCLPRFLEPEDRSVLVNTSLASLDLADDPRALAAGRSRAHQEVDASVCSGWARRHREASSLKDRADQVREVVTGDRLTYTLPNLLPCHLGRVDDGLYVDLILTTWFEHRARNASVSRYRCEYPLLSLVTADATNG